MAIELQLRRGTTAENDLFTGALAEVTVDTNKHKLRVHDGSTQGGFPVALESDITDRISNCVTEIPQDINLTLSSGTLTIKAGSVLTDPQDGTQRTTTQDQTGTLTANGQYMVFADRTTGALQLGSGYTVAKIGSGSTLPADGSTFNVFYNSTDKKMYRWGGSSWVVWAVAFPLGIITVSSGAISSIDQVFNGFGYMGSSRFILPNVKVLIPNGRNADGTLKTTSYTNSAVNIYSLSGATTVWSTLGSAGDNYGPYYEQTEKPSGSGLWYNPDTNLLMRSTDGGATWVQRAAAVVCKVVTTTGGQITSLTAKQPFHAVDYSEADFVVASQLPTSANNYTWYRKYKSGWVEQGGYTFDNSDSEYTFTLPVAMADSNYTLTLGVESTAVSTALYAYIGIRSKTATNVTLWCNSAYIQRKNWQVSGLAA